MPDGLEMVEMVAPGSRVRPAATVDVAACYPATAEREETAGTLRPPMPSVEMVVTEEVPDCWHFVATAAAVVLAVWAALVRQVAPAA